MNSQPKRPRGFSMIEILVVIVIIGVLSTMATIMMKSVRSKALDAKRIADVRSMQQAMELYQTDEGGYPVGLIWGQPLVGPTSKKTYMNKIPLAPDASYSAACAGASGGYNYTQNGPNSYSLNYCLENPFEKCQPGQKTAVPGIIMNGCGGPVASAPAPCSCAGKCAGEMDACGTTACGAPTVPDVINLVANPSYPGQVDISWDTVARASSYELCIKPQSSGSCAGGSFTATDTTTNAGYFYKTSLSNSTAYNIAIRAKICSGNNIGAVPSSQVAVTTLDACIASPNCPSNVCGDGSSLSCGATDFVANGSLTLNSGNASAYQDATTYSAVKIGTQCWLNKNLNIGTMRNYDAAAKVANASSGVSKHCTSNDNNNCLTDGGLYTWSMAMYLNGSCNGSTYTGYSGAGASARRQGLCPVGWHIPSDYEWSLLEYTLDNTLLDPRTSSGNNPASCSSPNHSWYADNLGSGAGCDNREYNMNGRGITVGTKMKCSTFNNPNWLSCGTSGLNIPLAAYSTSERGVTSALWASSQYDGASAWIRYLITTAGYNLRATNPKNYAYAIRCIKDY